MRSSVLTGGSPISRYEVTGPDGELHPYSLAYDLDEVRTRFDLDDEKATLWAARATRE